MYKEYEVKIIMVGLAAGGTSPIPLAGKLCQHV